MTDRFSTVPKDIIIYIALTMDVPEILSLCQVSKIFNNTICLNNNFWYGKLKQDFDIDKRDTYLINVMEDLDPNMGMFQPVDIVEKSMSPKEYYQYIRSEIPTDINKIQKTMFIGVIEEDLDLVKAAIAQGADVNKLGHRSDHILYCTLDNKDLKIAEYISNLPQLDKKKVPEIDLTGNGNLGAYIENYNIYIDEINREVYDYLMMKGLIKSSERLEISKV